MDKIAPLKVLHIQLLPMLSGAQKVTLNEISEIKNSNVHDDISFSVACKGEGPLTDELEKLNVEYFQVSTLCREISLFNDIKSLLNLKNIIENNKFDVVHTHSSKTGILGRIAAKLAGNCKVIHTVHGFSFPAAKSPVSKFIYFFMEWAAKFFTDSLIVLNNTDYRIAVDKIGFKENKVQLIPNGVNINKFSPNQEKSSGFNLVMLGRLWEQKDPLTLLEAMSLIIAKYPDITADLIGDGELMGDLERFIESHHLSDNVRLLGWKDGVHKLMPSYNLFVLPSLWEGLPLAILEAQACGLPCVVTDIPGNRDLVESGKTGFLFESSDAQQLANAIERLYREPELVREMSINARENVVLNYSSSSRNKQVLSIYRN